MGLCGTKVEVKDTEPCELDLIIKNKRWYKLLSHLEHYADLRITLDGLI